MPGPESSTETRTKRFDVVASAKGTEHKLRPQGRRDKGFAQSGQRSRSRGSRRFVRRPRSSCRMLRRTHALESGGHHRRRHRSTPRSPRTGLGPRSATPPHPCARARAARARVRLHKLNAQRRRAAAPSAAARRSIRAAVKARDAPRHCPASCVPTATRSASPRGPGPAPARFGRSDVLAASLDRRSLGGALRCVTPPRARESGGSRSRRAGRSR